MAGPDIYTAAPLFAAPPHGLAARGLLTDHQYVAQALDQELLDATYFALRGTAPQSVNDCVALWEMRLLLLLFCGQLAAARREAVALNNALYLHESPAAPPPPGGPPGGPPVYPLPNNNDARIPDSMLMLMLSLKAAPGLARVNEIYRMCYQKRLRGTAAAGGVGLQASLLALAYAVAAALLVSRNHSTLVSFLAALRRDLLDAIARGAATGMAPGGARVADLETHLSNFTLAWVLAKIHARGAPPPASAEDVHRYQAELAQVDCSTWVAVLFVTARVAPQIDGEAVHVDAVQTPPSAEDLASRVWRGEVSVRTVCCLLALWSLAAGRPATLAQDSFRISPAEPASEIGRAYAHVMAKWSEHFNKLFGLE